MLSYIVLCLELQKKLIPNWIGYTGIPRLNIEFFRHSTIYLTYLFFYLLGNVGMHYQIKKISYLFLDTLIPHS